MNPQDQAAGIAASGEEAILLLVMGDAREVLVAARAKFEAAEELADSLDPEDVSPQSTFIRNKATRDGAKMHSAEVHLRAASEDYTKLAVARASTGGSSGGASGVLPGTSASGGTMSSSSNKNLKRKLPVPSLGWKDASGKDHRAHTMRYRFLARISDIFWQLLDRLVISAEQSQGTAPASELQKDVHLANLVEREDEMDSVFQALLLSLPIRGLLEMGLNELNESACSLYVGNRYNQAVVDTFCGTESGGAERGPGLFSRLDVAVKRVQKLSVNQRAAVGSTGAGFAARGSSSGGRRGGRGSGARRPQQPPQQPTLFQLPPGFGAQRAPVPAGGRLGGGGNSLICFTCGAAGHMARDCPNKPAA